MVIFHKADMSFEGRDVFPATKVRRWKAPQGAIISKTHARIGSPPGSRKALGVAPW
jgi:hypothetical protein